MNSYTDLVVWQRAMDLLEEIYKLVKILPPDERFSLADQMRRAAVSIPSNIAEGKGRESKKEFIRFLLIALGSKNELETQLYICVRVGYLSDNEISKALNLCDEIGRMTNKLLKILKNE